MSAAGGGATRQARRRRVEKRATERSAAMGALEARLAAANAPPEAVTVIVRGMALVTAVDALVVAGNMRPAALVHVAARETGGSTSDLQQAMDDALRLKKQYLPKG